MPELSLTDLVEATGGKLLRGDPATRVDSFGIDTRTLNKSGVFFALAGEHRDGHRFLGDHVIERLSAPRGFLAGERIMEREQACGSD